MRQLIIAFADMDLALKVRTLLRGCGISVDEICSSAAAVLQCVGRMSDGGLVLCPPTLPDMSASTLMELLPETFDMLAVVSSRQQSLYERPGMFILTQPFQTDMLADSIRQIMETRQLSFTRQMMDKKPRPELTSKQRSQEEEKLIAQAKYLLMNRRKFSEPEAHRYLQRRSMESGMRMADLARQLIGSQ
ncbi:MAG: ANTAR domain-containing protein [Clostridiaceae bacterium]|nr:ANTAR domain-containing protein [Clostridiaceae bacterium]